MREDGRHRDERRHGGGDQRTGDTSTEQIRMPDWAQVAYRVQRPSISGELACWPSTTFGARLRYRPLWRRALAAAGRMEERAEPAHVRLDLRRASPSGRRRSATAPVA